MRVGLLAPPHSKEAGGGYTYVAMVFAAVERFAFRAEIVILDFRAIDYFPESDIVDDESVRPSAPVNVRFTRALNHHIRLHRLDLLWLVTPSTIMTPSIPFIVTVWDLAHRYYPFFPEVSKYGWTWQEREDYHRTTLPRASYVLTGTRRGAHEITTCYGIPDERIRVIPLPAPRIDAKIGEAASPVKGRYLFYPAQFWPHKNHVRAIRALRLLVEDAAYKDLGLVFVGADKDNEGFVRQLVRDEGVTDHVHFLGFVERPVVEALYRNAAALLYLSFLGPDNLPPLEAFDCLCPVIISDHAGHREQLGDAALYVDPLDEKAIADAVRTLLGDPSLREKLVERGAKANETRRIESYLSAIDGIFAEFAAYRLCWAAGPSPSV